jgi:hypothetical protein
MDIENTDLERRVLAHEQILKGSHCPYGRNGAEFWTGYRKYSRNTTRWALTSRTIPIPPHTQSSLSIT